MRAVYQPIIDTSRGVVVGYEGLTRFDLGEGVGIEELFSQARSAGRSAEVEAQCMRVVLAQRESIPSNCFLTVNVSPAVLRDDHVRAVWIDNPDLRGVFVELTEQTEIESYTALEQELATIRGTGALLAVDDVGSGYAGLTHLLGLKPALIKLDRELIRGIDTDEAKRALVEMLGTFASRIDCWLLAEGIETAAEYDAILELGVPLAQGFYLARPAPAWPGLSHILMPASGTEAVTVVRELCDPVPAATSVAEATRVFADYPLVRTVVLIDQHNRPLSVLDSESSHLGMIADGLRVNLDTPLRDALLRAVTRERSNRYDPLLLIDNAGRYAGIARIERLITATLR